MMNTEVMDSSAFSRPGLIRTGQTGFGIHLRLEGDDLHSAIPNGEYADGGSEIIGKNSRRRFSRPHLAGQFSGVPCARSWRSNYARPRLRRGVASGSSPDEAE